MEKCECKPILPSSAELFELSKWEHTSIFDGLPFIWNALINLRVYLEGLPKKACPLKTMYDDSRFSGEDGINFNGAEILPFTTIDAVSGPIFLGQGARIGPCAYVRGPAIISKECVVGHCSEVKNSIMMPGSHASHRCYVSDSILGNNVHLASNTSLNSRRFNEQNVVVATRCQCPPDCLCQDLHIETLMKKFGSILGDKVKIGSNVAVNPGTIIHQGSWLFSAREYGPGVLTQGMIRMDRKHL